MGGGTGVPQRESHEWSWILRDSELLRLRGKKLLFNVADVKELCSSDTHYRDVEGD